jgi:iron complex outermembrane recepter protein
MDLKTLVLCSTSVAILTAAATPAWAQTTPPQAPTAQETPNNPDDAPPPADDPVEGEEDAALDDEVEGVVVTGLRRSLQSAQSIRRNSDQIVDAIVAEDIGKLPDVTASDSLARVTGVQVERGGGEAGRVLVRGLPDITTTYNGRDIFTAEARFVAVQDFPAGGVSALEVYKSSTPNLVEPGIAGLINVRSRRPFDFSERHIGGSLRYTYATQSQEWDPNGNLLLSDRWDTGAGEIGALLNVSYTQLRYLDSARFNGGFIAAARPEQVTNPALNGFRYPDGIGIFYGQANRSRPSVNAAVQWRPNANLEIYADALYQGYRNEGEDRLLFVPLFGDTRFSNVVLRPGTNTAQSLTATGAVRPDGFQGAADGATDTYQVGIGAIYNVGPWRFSTDLAHTDSVFDLSVYSYDFAFASSPVVDVNFDVPREDGGVEFSFRNFDTNNPANFVYRGFFDRHLIAAGDDIQWRADVEYETGDPWIIDEVKFGVRYADRNGSFDNGERYNYQEPLRLPLTATPVTLHVSPAGFRGSDVQQMRTWITPTRDSIRSNIAALRTLAGFPQGRPPFNPVQHFEANEKSYAAYGQLHYGFDAPVLIDGVVGVRAVRTEISVTGNSRVIVNGTEQFQPRNEQSDYTDYLPSFTMRIQPAEAFQIRLAANRTRTRPNFNQLNPGLFVDPNPDPSGRRNASGGNIDLRPIESDNFDVAFEYYFSPTGNATLTFFQRNVDGFIANQVTDVVDPIYGFLRVTRPENLQSAILSGMEASFTTFFDWGFLPEWARGFGVQLNHTYIEGDLPGISEHSSNVVGMYERGPLSARLAWNTRSEYTAVGAPSNEYTDDVSRLDFSSSYTPFENITFTFDASNILGEPFRNFGRYGTAGTYPRDVRFEETIYSLGLRFRL